MNLPAPVVVIFSIKLAIIEQTGLMATYNYSVRVVATLEFIYETLIKLHSTLLITK